MDRPLLRSLLRHIALGTPFVLGPAGLFVTPALLGCGHCETAPDVVTQTVHVEPTEGGEAPVCAAVCEAQGLPSAGCSVPDAQTVQCETRAFHSCGAGRLPIARVERRASGRTWLLETATLELAAVAAFDELARALEAHRAPPQLAARARAAARDEVRHARTMIALAGPAARASVSSPASEVPPLATLALHNAREGCVYEALAALDAAHQARHAPDPALRRAMAGIARDEARHALLSLDLDVWARTQLDARHARALDEATIDTLRAAADLDDVPDVGLIDRAARARLLLAA